MSNANNFLQNMGMQMPMFASANQQTTNSDDVDLHDIFADYFNEDGTNINSNANVDLFSNAFNMAQQQQQQQQQQVVVQQQQVVQQVAQQQQVTQQQQQQQLAANHQQQLAANIAVAVAQQQAAQQQAVQQQQLSLPTGQGIKTAWHTGSLPSMQQQQQQGVSTGGNNNSIQQHPQQQPPAAKRLRGEDMFLPGQQQQQQQQQQHQQPLGQTNMGGIGGGNNLAITQQQLALAQAASGVGALSGRLGFTLPNNNNAGIMGGVVGGGGGSNMMGQQAQQQGITLPTQQQQQQQVPTQQQVPQQHQQQSVASINLPIGMGINPMGIKVSPMNIIPQAQAQARAPGIQVGIHHNVGGLLNGNVAASSGIHHNIVAVAGNNGVMNNNTVMTNNNPIIAQGALAANNSHRAVGVTNMQYGIPPQLQLLDKSHVEDQMAAERRLRNREHAKRSRVRKKFMLESLQQQVRGLQDENSTLRMLVQKNIPMEALKIIDDCCSKSVLFGTGDDDVEGLLPEDLKEGETKGGETTTQKSTPLLRSDFSLITSLTSGQQNFVLSDPRLPDNPIVFASPGFYELTGYTREQVLGRNCRFLQGAGTDRKHVDVIRTAVANGTDATVCLLNYKADGTPFWNQLFVAALRDADNCIVNYVGVQTMIEPNAGASALEDKVNAAHPISVGVDDDIDYEDAKK